MKLIDYHPKQTPFDRGRFARGLERRLAEIPPATDFGFPKPEPTSERIIDNYKPMTREEIAEEADTLLGCPQYVQK